MSFIEVKCDYCNRPFTKTNRRYNESIKQQWKFYCSSICQNRAKTRQRKFKCGNPTCINTFDRIQSAIPKSGICFCSQSCAAVVNNSKSIKRRAKIKTCPICKKEYTGSRKYCSYSCIPKKIISQQKILNMITSFYQNNNRIPLKNEFHHWKAARERFGTWNKAIQAAGYLPNPVMFAKKYIANDGHKCDSLAEKIIDDWLFARKITHKRSIPYPTDPKLTCDFLVGDYWIEFFGLKGELRSYDKLRKRKLQIVKKLGLNFIEITPRHLFPKNKLSYMIQKDKYWHPLTI